MDGARKLSAVAVAVTGGARVDQGGDMMKDNDYRVPLLRDLISAKCGIWIRLQEGFRCVCGDPL